MFHSNDQIWNSALARNAGALRLLMAQLLGMLAGFGGLEAHAVPRALRVSMLSLLRPAESALRRLIVIAARNVEAHVPPAKPRPAPQGKRKEKGPQSPLPSRFALFDPRQRFRQREVRYTRFKPRITFFMPAPPVVAMQLPEAPAPRDPEIMVGARRLCQRLKAVAAALDDLPGQALRLARIRLLRARRKSSRSPLRPGRPPGFRARPRVAIDVILADCHRYALGVLAERPQNSS